MDLSHAITQKLAKAALYNFGQLWTALISIFKYVPKLVALTHFARCSYHSFSKVWQLTLQV